MNKLIFPYGEQAPSEYFTGTVWLNILVTDDATKSYVVASVTFEPGGRTHWHTHPAGQILLVIEGHGIYQEKGKNPQQIVKGDVIQIPPSVEHWHGASANNGLTHLAITNKNADGHVKWLAPVTAAEYEI